jgi:hypothetical protein
MYSSLNVSLSSFFLPVVPHIRRLGAGFPPWCPVFDPRSRHVGFAVDEIAVEQVQYFGLHCQFSLFLPSTLYFVFFPFTSIFFRYETSCLVPHLVRKNSFHVNPDTRRRGWALCTHNTGLALTFPQHQLHRDISFPCGNYSCIFALRSSQIPCEN